MGPLPTLLALDFDWSLIEENSDTFVIKELWAEAIYKQGREQGLPWTQLMDHVLLEAAQQLGRTPADVTAALQRTPLHPALSDLLRQAAAAGGGTATDIIIVSDANTVYIDTILEQYRLRHLILEIHTNPAEWRDGALRVAPYHAQPHGCPRQCSPNLCKGQVLLEFLARQRAAGRQYSRVLYVGDGRGDYCPSALLLHGGGGSGCVNGTAAGATAAGGGATAPARIATAAANSDAPAPSAGLDAGDWQAMCSSSKVFARDIYPDGLPCSLWVMLRTEASSGSKDGSGSSSSGGAGSTAAAAAGATVSRSCAAPGADGGLVAWSRPEQLGALLKKELQLDY